MKWAVLVNGGAGPAQRHESSRLIVRGAFRQCGLDPMIAVVPPDEIVPAAQRFLEEGAGALIAAGGDGTVSSVAEIAAAARVPLGVIPLGTLNHFAKDLGMPSDPVEAIAVIAKSQTLRIDLGRVNGRAFINNSSLGAYPRLVQERDNRRRAGINRWPATLAAILRVWRDWRPLRCWIEHGGSVIERRTPFLFVGNNEYSIDLLTLRHRTCMSAGALCAYVARTQSFTAFLRLFWLALAHRLHQSRDFEKIIAPRFTVRTLRSTARVAKDGELLRLTTPLEYNIDPCALEVFAPPESRLVPQEKRPSTAAEPPAHSVQPL